MDTDRFKTSTQLEAIEGLKFTLECLAQLPADPYRWKWAILAMDNSLQNWMVEACKDSAGHNILDFKSTRQAQAYWLNHYLQRGHSPEEIQEFYLSSPLDPKLIEKLNSGEELPFVPEALVGFQTLFAMVRSQWMQRYVHSKPLEPTPWQTMAVFDLHEWRNEFVHFLPRTLYFGVCPLPTVFLDVLDVMAALAFESGNVYIYDQREAVERLFADVRAELLRLALYYEALAD